MKNNQIAGYVAGIVTGVTYGLNPLFAVPLMNAGANVESILFFRYSLAVVLLGLWLLIRKQSFKISGRQAVRLLILGLLFTASSLCLFEAYKYIPSGLATTIVFLYPVLVALIMVFLRVYPTWQVWLSIIVTFIGVIILCKGDSTEQMHWTGLLIAGASALAYAMFIVIVNRSRTIRSVSNSLLTFYALLTGASPSVVRSCIMAIFVLLAPLLRRDSDPITSLSAALLVILLQNPFAAASISLQLSFSSVAGLLLVSPRLYQTLLGSKTHGRVYRFLAASFSATIGALVFTTPLTAAYFNMLVLIAPVSNLLCLYAAAGAFISGIVSVGLGMASSALGSLLGLAPQALVWYILKAVHLLSQIPGHAVYFSNPYLKYWLLYVYLLFSAAWLIRSGDRRKYALAAGLAAGTLVLTLRAGALRYGDGTLDVQVLEVGQGQCVLVYSGGSCTLVDCGSANSWYDPGTIAADTLYSMGCGRLEHLVLTHYDTDHISGVETLLSRIDVETLVVPGLPDSAAGNALLEAAREQGTQVQILREETVWDLGASTLTVYPPLGDGESNEAGLSILCSSGDFDLLITGDMDSNTEEQLLSTYDLPDLEALVVGHHGSKYSTSEALLSTLTPELAFISVGDNSYGHPSDQALWRLVQAGAAIYRTDLQGTIHLTVN